MDTKGIIRPSKQKTEDSMKMKLDILQSDNMEFNDTQEHDRVTEKLSYSVPMAPLPPTPDLGLSSYIGKYVQLHLRNGSVVTGDMIRPQRDLVRLENVEKTWKGFRLRGDWGAVRDDTVAEIYPGNAQVEKIE